MDQILEKFMCQDIIKDNSEIGCQFENSKSRTGYQQEQRDKSIVLKPLPPQSAVDAPG